MILETPPCFELELRPVMGSTINECVRNACQIAARIGLHSVTFSNGSDSYACFPDGRALHHRRDGSASRYWDRGKWIEIKPLSPLPPSEQETQSR